MPVTITRPAQPRSVSTARAKPSSSLGTSARIASASSRSTRSAMRRRSSLLKIPLAGGPEMAPRPPALGRAPAPPWRASGTQEAPRPPALGRAPAQPWRASGTQEAPRPPALGRAPAQPWRASGTQEAPRPPALGRAPAQPWRASGTQEAPRPPALGRAPAQPWRASGTQEAPRPPELGRARAKPWRALGTRDVSSCPTLGQQDGLVALREDLVDDVLHVSRGDELALLDVDGLAGGRRRQEQIGLAAQERGDLEHVQHVGGGIDLRDLMDVREHRHAQRVAHLLQDSQSFDEAGPAVAVDRRAVGLVVRRFVDVGHPAVGSDLRQALGRHERVLFVFDRARAADEHEWMPAADGDRADMDLTWRLL